MISLELLKEAESRYERIRAFKDDLHRHPELAFREKRTTARIREELCALGYEEISLGMETGAVFFLRGGKPGKCVALRADIDALELQEPAGGRVVSLAPGLMHACGHDFHAACLYGAAMLLKAHQQELRGSAALIFQPAEEPTVGAKAMLDAGLLEKLPAKPEFLFGLHNRPEIETGKIAVKPGALMARKSNFRITLRGTAGHAGSPHKYVDAIVAGGALINAVQSIVSRNIDPLESAVCCITAVRSGTPENFITEDFFLAGDIRTHSDPVHELVTERLAALAHSIAAAYRCTAEVEILPVVPLTFNSDPMTVLARKAAAMTAGEENIVSPAPSLASEDFAVLGRRIPSFFYWLGTGRPGVENAPWHSERFRTDDSALPMGAALLAQSVFAALET